MTALETLRQQHAGMEMVISLKVGSKYAFYSIPPKTGIVFIVLGIAGHGGLKSERPTWCWLETQQRGCEGRQATQAWKTNGW